MSGWKELARQALRGALETRRRTFTSKFDPICVYDIAARLGVEVIFRPESSLGGMYAKASQTILVPARRPPGFRAFSCAHELGHWFFGHGTGIDNIEQLERYYENDPEERLADTFASYLLMPPWAVTQAFANRNWNPANCNPIQMYTIAGQLGVGYQTLIQHLRYSLHLISPIQAQQLLKTTPKQMRVSVLGDDITQHLIIVDRAWNKVAIDLQVGHFAILPTDAKLEGASVSIVGDNQIGLVVEGHIPGITRAETSDGSWAAYIRVSRKDFIGRSIFLHEEDPDFDGT